MSRLPLINYTWSPWLLSLNSYLEGNTYATYGFLCCGIYMICTGTLYVKMYILHINVEVVYRESGIFITIYVPLYMRKCLLEIKWTPSFGTVKYQNCLTGDKYFNSGNYFLQSMKFPCFKIKFLLQSVPSRTYPLPLWVRHLGRSIYLRWKRWLEEQVQFH